MDIVEGLLSHMVLQRNRLSVSDAPFSGRCKVSGTLMARVRSEGETVRGFARVRVGRAGGGKLTGRLKGLPIGGPYDVELRVVDAEGRVLDGSSVDDLLVGDVWILAGQSNMQGIGLLRNRLKAVRQVRACYMDDHWAPAEDPIHNMHAAVDPVHIDLCGGVRPEPDTYVGVGPGVAFGQDMFKATGVPQGLIPCAHGGTSMTQWNPALKKRGGHSLHGAMVRRFRKNGSKVAGMLWYQGESDAIGEDARLYTQRMKTLVRAMRRDLRDARLPVAVVQISRVVQWNAAVDIWNSVQDQQRHLPETVANLTVVPAIDLSLEDTIHISARDQHRLGRRLARAMRVLRQGRKAGKPPIALKSVTIRTRPRDGLADLVVEFANVEGRLCSGSRPTGFVMRDPEPTTPFCDVELSGNKAIIHTLLTSADLEPMQLQYGYGHDPYCNITDEADRSLPVFGPVPTGRPRAVGRFVKEFLVSPFLPADARLKDLKHPGALESLKLRPRRFRGRHCCRTAEILKTRGREGTYYYGCRIECQENMKLQALLGYDGPVKVWIDGAETFHDPNGTNPASPLDAEVPLGTLSKGRHELLVAMGNNNGNAWGIFLRLERLGLSPSRIQKGPEAYAVPRVHV